uniref:Uncharacterized protein n=1 Tax=Glossina austeni TaxID=7395 RepID=A0A1A9VYX0_GLOAU
MNVGNVESILLGVTCNRTKVTHSLVASVTSKNSSSLHNCYTERKCHHVTSSSIFFARESFHVPSNTRRSLFPYLRQISQSIELGQLLKISYVPLPVCLIAPLKSLENQDILEALVLHILIATYSLNNKDTMGQVIINIGKMQGIAPEYLRGGGKH